MRPPRFRAKNFPTCARSQTARGSSHASQCAMGDVAFSSSERDRHLGIRPVSQLNTRPVVSPVNASRRPSRDAAHHSGSGWLARPSPWGTFTSYSLPACPGALRDGSTSTVRRDERHVRTLPDRCRMLHCRRSALGPRLCEKYVIVPTARSGRADRRSHARRKKVGAVVSILI